MFDVKMSRELRFAAANVGTMPDDRILEWATELLEHDVRAFKLARVRFLRRPTAERLHDVRVSARRLRSLCTDLHDVLPHVHRKRLHQLIALTADARDAAVLRETLRQALDVRERRVARPLLRALRQRERTALKCVARTLERAHPYRP